MEAGKGSGLNKLRGTLLYVHTPSPVTLRHTDTAVSTDNTPCEYL